MTHSSLRFLTQSLQSSAFVSHFSHTSLSFFTGGSPGLGEMPQSDAPRPAHKARGDQEYDYGSYGGVSLEDAAAGLDSGGDSPVGRTSSPIAAADSTGYDYGDFGGVTLEECMAGVDELTERELDAQEAAQRFGMEPEEQSEDDQLADEVERRVAEEREAEERSKAQFGDLLGGGGDGGGDDGGFAACEFTRNLPLLVSSG